MTSPVTIQKKRKFIMMVKLTQNLSRGLKPWKELFHENEAFLNALGGKLVLAGAEKEDDIKLTVILDF